MTGVRSTASPRGPTLRFQGFANVLFSAALLKEAIAGALCRAHVLSPFFRSALIVALLCALGGCTLKSKVSPQGPTVTGSAISRTALATVGTSYVSGGTTPAKGFDCSGLVCWAYAQNGVFLPRTAKEQSRIGERVGKKALREGDVVVFNVRGGLHTGIYTGGGKFVHSPSRGKKVREDNMESDYWRNRFVAGRRHGRLH